MLTDLKDNSDLKDMSMRVVTYSMLSSDEGVEPILTLGIDPEEEKKLSKFDEAIIAGDYISSVSGGDLILGWKLAEKMELRLGERLVLTAVDAESGEMVQELFRLSGIYKTGDNEIDASMALAPRETLQHMLKLEGKIHEIAMRYAHMNENGTPAKLVTKPDKESGNDLSLWTELMPAMQAALQLTDQSMAIMGLILFFIVALGITNTLLMGLYERMFEFGIIKSIGTTPWQTARLMVYEAFCLGVFGSIVGLMLAVIVTILFAKYGIDYTGIEYSGITFQEKIYPSIHLERLVVYPFWSLGFTLVASLYPAFKLWRMLPVEALRKRKF